MANVHESFWAVAIFRGHPQSRVDGALIARGCSFFVDSFNVLCVRSEDQSIRSTIYFPLNNAKSIDFKKIRSGTGRLTMGRVTLVGLFGSEEEKITIKLDLDDYNRLIEASRSWP